MADEFEREVVDVSVAPSRWIAPIPTTRRIGARPLLPIHGLAEALQDVLERAWELVRANKGAAGIDRQTIAEVEEYGPAKLLDQLAADLKDGRWRPLAARRVFIRKPGSPTETSSTLRSNSSARHARVGADAEAFRNRPPFGVSSRPIIDAKRGPRHYNYS
ncbi:MAG: hypothetical protein ACLP01_07070 [Solirubrobacteraceae bacterium]